MVPKTPAILLVEDDINLGYVIKDNLIESGYQVVLCEDGEQALNQYYKNAFDLCILDIMMPKKDGITLAREIRKADQMIPVIFLTAKSLKEDKINGFKVGADDYITKPFSIEELICRVEVFLKRTRQQSERGTADQFKIGAYTFDYLNQILHHQQDRQKLTHRESEILKLLYLNHYRILKREEILTKIWGDDDYFSGRSLDVFISKLRKYLQKDPAVEIINYHGVGFKLELQAVR